nr:hypothetical protein [Burkholderiales bacterium]
SAQDGGRAGGEEAGREEGDREAPLAALSKAGAHHSGAQNLTPTPDQPYCAVKSWQTARLVVNRWFGAPVCPLSYLQ